MTCRIWFEAVRGAASLFPSRVGWSVVLLLGLFAVNSHAKKIGPVEWSLSTDATSVAPGSSVLLRLKAVIAPGFHLYSLTTPQGGPIPTTIRIAAPPIAGVSIYEPKPERHTDPSFNIPVETYSGEVDFLISTTLRKDVAEGPLMLDATVRYQACSDRICLPPVERLAVSTISIQKSAGATNIRIPKEYVQTGKPVRERSGPAKSGPHLSPDFLLLAFGFGLAAIFTPCVFPMMPLTVSYFLKRNHANRRAVVFQALLFCAGIVVLFSALGLLVTLVAGPFGVVELSNSAWVNGLIAVVFLALGLSLLGLFEITLPSGVLTKLDGASQQGGLIGGILLGLTFCLTSFACVGPFVGSLLASSVQTSPWTPAAGMVAFAFGLATPFFGLALFPAFLQRLPRSGAWLARVKIVFGFVILAVMMKYLIHVDQVLQLHLLTRERFLAVWFALFLMPALYLLGQLRLPGAQEDGGIGPARVLVGVGFLAFAVSLLPGMVGSSLGELESFLPVSEGQSSWAPAGPAPEMRVWIKNDYPAALAIARREHKPVLVSFSGYACTNCHWMKANIFPRPEVATALKDFVLLELYTDGTDTASRQNQALEQDRFSTIALPLYAVIDENERVLATSAGLTRNAEEFARFLRFDPQT